MPFPQITLGNRLLVTFFKMGGKKRSWETVHPEAVIKAKAVNGVRMHGVSEATSGKTYTSYFMARMTC